MRIAYHFIMRGMVLLLGIQNNCMEETLQFCSHSTGMSKREICHVVSKKITGLQNKKRLQIVSDVTNTAFLYPRQEIFCVKRKVYIHNKILKNTLK